MKISESCQIESSTYYKLVSIATCICKHLNLKAQIMARTSIDTIIFIFDHRVLKYCLIYTLQIFGRKFFTQMMEYCSDVF